MAPTDLTRAFQANPKLSGGQFYINIHSSWRPAGAIAGYVVSNEIPMALTSPCNVQTEVQITGSTTNTSAASSCDLTDCTYFVDTALFTCSPSYNFGMTGELVQAVHLHWRPFTYQSIAYASQRFTFPAVAGTAQGMPNVANVAVPVNMTVAIQSDPSLQSMLFYLNGKQTSSLCWILCSAAEKRSAQFVVASVAHGCFSR